MLRGRLHPILRCQMRLGKPARANAVVALGMDRAGHDPCVVAAGGQQEGEVVRADEVVHLVDRLPRRDVIGLGAHDEHRHADVRQPDQLAADRKAVRRELVVEVEPIQILRMHPPRHARAVGIPGHQVDHSIALALEVLVDDGLPQQIACTQHRERSAHLPALEHALAVHRGFEHRQLARIDEEGQLARLGEVGLRGEHRDRGQPLVLVARERRRADGEQGAADAVAHGVDPALGHDGGDGVDRSAKPFLDDSRPCRCRGRARRGSSTTS